jgi:hypothetical protein
MRSGYPPLSEQRNGSGEEQRYAAPLAAALESEIAGLKQVNQLLRDQLDDMDFMDPYPSRRKFCENLKSMYRIRQRRAYHGDFTRHCGPCILFQHYDGHALGTPLLIGAFVLHGNVSAISGNVCGISRVCGGMRSLG